MPKKFTGKTVTSGAYLRHGPKGGVSWAVAGPHGREHGNALTEDQARREKDEALARVRGGRA